MAWSPYKEMVVSYVARNPGCCKWDVACYVTRNPRCNPSKQYYIVNTALRNGWIEGEFRGGRYHLTLPIPKVIPLPEGRVVFDSEGGFRVENN